MDFSRFLDPCGLWIMVFDGLFLINIMIHKSLIICVIHVECPKFNQIRQEIFSLQSFFDFKTLKKFWALSSGYDRNGSNCQMEIVRITQMEIFELQKRK